MEFIQLPALNFRMVTVFSVLLLMNFVTTVYSYVTLNVQPEIIRINQTINITCTVHGIDIINNKLTRQWSKGPDLICYNGHPIDSIKYTEILSAGNQFKLQIKNISESDVNYKYQCRYGFESQAKNIHASKDNFEYPPTDELRAIVHQNESDRFLTVNLHFKKIFPLPICTAEIEGSSLPFNITSSKSVGNYYEVMFRHQSKNKLHNNCNREVIVKCKLIKEYTIPTRDLRKCSFEENTSKDLKVVILVTFFPILVLVIFISFLIMCKLRKTEDELVNSKCFKHFVELKLPCLAIREKEISKSSSMSSNYSDQCSDQAKVCLSSDKECPDGRFGFNCVHECHCKNLEPCDKQTGRCHQCYDGMFGPNCQIKCIAGQGGIICSEPCEQCKVIVCDQETGQCLTECNNGWKGDRCNKCEPGKYGISCSETCGKCKNMLCDYETGKCLNGCNAGWKEDRCNTKCETGKYGTNCSKTCGKCKDMMCYHETGQCQNRCNDGWKGDHCNKKCEAGKYGTNCRKKCRKCKDMMCDHETGRCLNGCNAGMIRDLCNTKCPDGRFGLNCAYKCHCQNPEPCDKQTGKCTHCYDGWIRRACGQKCEAGKYGIDSNETCGKCKENLCNHETGQCLNGCNTGWEGYLCNTSFSYTSEKRNNSPWMIICFVIGGIMMVSICLNIYCLLKRRGSSTIVSEIPLEVQYDEIGTINDNSASVRALSNNVLEAEIIADGPAIGRVSHHLSSTELSTSSEDSVHNLSVSLLSVDGYEHPYQTIDPENIE